MLSLRADLEHLILGADPHEETQLGLQVTLAGVSQALLTFPSWDDERLRAFLLGTGRRLLKPSRIRSTAPLAPQVKTAHTQPAAAAGPSRP